MAHHGRRGQPSKVGRAHPPTRLLRSRVAASSRRCIRAAVSPSTAGGCAAAGAGCLGIGAGGRTRNAATAIRERRMAPEQRIAMRFQRRFVMGLRGRSAVESSARRSRGYDRRALDASGVPALRRVQLTGSGCERSGRGKWRGSCRSGRRCTRRAPCP